MNAPFTHVIAGFSPVIWRMPPEIRAGFMAEIERRMKSAFELQGEKTFDNTKRAAAAHEAGHAILFTAHGNPVKSVKIWPIKRGGKHFWIGEADATRGWVLTPFTAAADDLEVARDQWAGAIAEFVCDPDDYRYGSSLDEVVLAEMIIETAAGKLGVPPKLLMAAQAVRVHETITTNKAIFLELTATLERQCRLRGKPLARLLAEVKLAPADMVCGSGIEAVVETVKDTGSGRKA